MRLKTRPLFYEDIDAAMNYLTERAGAEIAVRWKAAVERTIQSILRQPGIGRARPDLKGGAIRSWRVDHFHRWLLFYMVEEESLVLLRVRYGLMDLPALEMES